MTDENDEPTVDRKKPSQVPSWLMLGFLVGVVTMWALRSEPKAPEAPPPAPPPTIHEIASAAPSLTAPEDSASLAIAEALFEEYRNWAFWNEDKTQIAIWNSTTLGFTDRFEIIRTLEGDYFRSIPSFTRVPIEGYGPENSPILFTETAEQKLKRDRALNPDAYPRAERPDPIKLNTLPAPPAGD